VSFRQPEPAPRLQRDVERLDRPGLERGEAEVEVEAFGGEQLAGQLGLLFALRGQADVPPAGEPVLEIPGGLAVAEQDELGHGLYFR
jgi:hypothetical protein